MPNSALILASTVPVITYVHIQKCTWNDPAVIMNTVNPKVLGYSFTHHTPLGVPTHLSLSHLFCSRRNNLPRTLLEVTCCRTYSKLKVSRRDMKTMAEKRLTGSMSSAWFQAKSYITSFLIKDYLLPTVTFYFNLQTSWCWPTSLGRSAWSFKKHVIHTVVFWWLISLPLLLIYFAS